MFKVRVLLEPIITKTLINGVHNRYNLYLTLINGVHNRYNLYLPLKYFSKIAKIFFLKRNQKIRKSKTIYF